MSEDWLDREIVALQAERGEVPSDLTEALWARLQPAVARRARRRRWGASAGLAAVVVASFAVGRASITLRPVPTHAATTTALEVQAAGASFVTRLASLRSEVESGTLAGDDLREARMVGVSLLTGAAAELARLGPEPELIQIFDLGVDARHRLSDGME